MTVRVHRATHGTYWRWTCDTCDIWDGAGDWDNAMEAATGHAVYRHLTAPGEIVVSNSAPWIPRPTWAALKWIDA